MTSLRTISVNPQTLVWARESIALSRNAAAERSGISNKKLLELEEGKSSPTLADLKALSKAYKRTIAALLLSTPPKEKPLPKDRRTINSSELGIFHEKTILQVRKARALAQSYKELHDEMGLSIPALTMHASMADKPELVAEVIRKRLNLSEVRDIKNINHALDAYIEKVESMGVAVFQLGLTQDGLRGFALVDDILPIIGIKRGSEAAHSKTFTLFHEFGHILLNEGALCDLSDKSKIAIEKWCNAFASEVLIPSKDLVSVEFVEEQQKRGNKTWMKRDLIDLANHFHVGPLAVLRKLLVNGLTTKEFYQEKHETWNKPGFGRAKKPEGRNIAKEAIKEKGRLFVSLAFSAFDENKIGIKDLSDFLGVKFSYLAKTRELLNI